MLPLSIQNRFKNPGSLEKHFINFLQKAGLEISNSKTIASQTLYNQVNTGANLNSSFFTDGQPDLTNSNIVGSFVRPQSEHFVVYAIRIFFGSSDVLAETDWEPGLNNVIGKNATMTITNNSEVELKNYPLNEALDNLTTKDQGLIILDQPIIWAGQTSLSVNFQFRTAGGADDNYRVQLIGLGLI